MTITPDMICVIGKWQSGHSSRTVNIESALIMFWLLRQLVVLLGNVADTIPGIGRHRLVVIVISCSQLDDTNDQSAVSMNSPEAGSWKKHDLGYDAGHYS